MQSLKGTNQDITNNKEQLSGIKDKTVDYTLGAIALLGSLVFALVIIRGFQFGFNLSFYTSTISILLFVTLYLLRKKFSYRCKMLYIAVFTPLIFVTGLYSFGYLSATTGFIIALPILFFFLEGKKFARWLIIVLLSFYTLFAFLHISGVLTSDLPADKAISTPVMWIIQGILLVLSSQGILFLGNQYIRHIQETHKEIDRQNQELLTQQAQYKLLFENSNDAIIILKNGRFFHFNQVAQKFFQQNESLLKGRSIASFSTPVDSSNHNWEVLFNEKIDEVATGNPVIFEWQLTKGNGEKLDVSVSLNLISADTEGEYIQAVLRDISQLKHSQAELEQREKDLKKQNLEYQAINQEYLQINEELNALLEELYESNNRNNALLSAVPDLLFILNTDGEVIDFHPADTIENIVSRDTFMNKRIEDVLPRNVLSTVQAAIEKLAKTNETQQLSLSLMVRNQLYFFESRLVTYGKDKILAILRDTTSQTMAENNWRESEERFRIAAESVNGIIYVIDHQMNFTLSKGQALSDINLKPDQLEGTSLYRFLGTNNPFDPVIDAHKKALAGKTVTLESTHNGITFSTVISPLKNIHGNITSVVGLSVNISEQKQLDLSLRESENKYRLIFDNSPLGIVHLDKNGVITRCNRFFTEVFGLNEEILTGIKFTGLLNTSVTEDIIRALTQGEHFTHEGNPFAQNIHQKTQVKIRLNPIIKNNEVQGAILLVEDLSEKLKHEELRKQISIARESAEFKQNFLAKMSHEIRTPLTGIMGMTDILLQTELKENQLEYVEMLKESGDNLRLIINQVLDFSKLEAGKVSLHKQDFAFQNIVTKAEKHFKSICKKKIEFQSIIPGNLPAYITADENKINQIINNLLNNAYKFTCHGQITLAAELVSTDTQAGSCTIKISVSDTGMGIPVEKQQFLFKPYAQVDSGSRKTFEGTGLGLTICKELAHIHGGTIGLKSLPGQGSTFWFTIKAEIPTTANLPETNNDAATSTSRPKNMRILLAEDQRVNQIVFKILFSSMGYEVTVADNGQKVLQIYQPGKFDIILMDIVMPFMGGIETLEKLRQNDPNLPPVIGLSANAFEGDREKYMDMGFDEYLTKPLNQDDFYKAIRSVYSRKPDFIA